EQILVFEAGYFGIPSREAKMRAGELLEFFSLASKRTEGYKKLSGGMKRRLLIARALMHRPKILILDEPTAGVDLELRYLLWDFLKKLNREGTTILLTTHYIEEAERLCGRIGVIHQGKIVAVDSTAALIRKMGGDRMEFYLKNDVTKVFAGVSSVPFTVESSGRKISFKAGEGAIPAVLKILQGHGVEVEQIDVRRPTLEDAFLKLIGKKGDGGA
ncbi:MAG: ABC transporter ATP-binding protein, partial [Candidatus Omnitrophica bacterium]|nr:ABC transporter ATP-binding protein [Candidatus Omnitrophota bacterium]